MSRRGHAAYDVVGLDEFRARFDCDVAGIPSNLALVGHSAATGRWSVHVDESELVDGRLVPFLDFWHRHLHRLVDGRTFWFLYCHWDGWREGTAYSSDYRWIDVPAGIGDLREWKGRPGDTPRFSTTHPWVLCFSAHAGDPTAVLFPDAHYLYWRYYRSFRTRQFFGRPTRVKRRRAVYAGGDHGPPWNLEEGAPSARRLLLETVQRERLNVDVFLSTPVTRRQQVAYRYLIDVEGWVHTWDAWAWKLASTSLLLAVDTVWESYFSRLFEPWQHFVPVAADLSDLGERLAWCDAHDAECRAIVGRARRRVARVYNPKWVARDLTEQLRARLDG